VSSLRKSPYAPQRPVAQNPFRSEFVSVSVLVKRYEVSKKLAPRRSNIFFRRFNRWGRL